MEAIDAFLKEHGLRCREDVLRIALGRLLGVEIELPGLNWQTEVQASQPTS